MKIEEIKTIVKLMSEHDLTEFKIEAEECNLCIRRGCSSPAPVVTQIAAPMPAAPAVAAAAPAPAAAA
ncbi:MAG TPA: acetyl-CoA carboxylase, biotin carboxyl carrier protein, partial [Lentisphaeria bacterium]|nr:acetyl-CoA carboxylase, biotin carboxyl carrier protein [Lentisphaeria bacterium]